jgi:hypothetical protein
MLEDGGVGLKYVFCLPSPAKANAPFVSVDPGMKRGCVRGKRGKRHQGQCRAADASELRAKYMHRKYTRCCCRVLRWGGGRDLRMFNLSMVWA